MLSTPTDRGCGRRKAGGIYIDCGLVPPDTPGAQPLEYFLYCPPKVVSEEMRQANGIKPVGVTLVQLNDGVYHVFDWIGATYYPNVPDFIEEVRRFGLSRRCELATEDFAKIGPQSQIYCIHPRAWIDQYEDVADHLRGNLIDWECPKRLPTHRPPYLDVSPIPEMCLGLTYHDLVQCEVDDAGVAFRTMPSFAYTGSVYPLPKNLSYNPAIFARFPIPQLVVVKDPEGGKDKGAYERARHSDVPVILVDE